MRSPFRFFARPRGLRAQVVLGNTLTLALLLVFLGIVVRVTVRTLMIASVERRLDQEVHSVPPPPAGHRRGDERDGPGPGLPPPMGGPPGRDGSEAGPPQGGPPQEAGFTNGGPGAGTLYSVRHFDLEGRPIGVRPLLDRAAFVAVKSGKQRHYFTVIPLGSETVEVLTIPYPQTGPVQVVIQAGYPLAELYRTLRSLDTALLLLIPVGLLAAGLSGTWLTGRVLRTVQKTTRAAERIGVDTDGRLSERLPVVGNDEFAALATTFNELLGRLEQTLQTQVRLTEQQQRFTADASHELKTPLTVIRGMTSLALDETAATVDPRTALKRIDTASASMAKLVQDLLLLARSDSGQRPATQTVLLTREVLEHAVAAFGQAGARVTIAVPDETLTVYGSENDLIRLFSNLLANALHHTPEAGVVSVTAQRAGNRARFQVADTGVGIAPEHLEHLGERFYRVDTARARVDGGSGLGLSICKSIVAAHEGTIAFASVPGAGTTVTVLLPAAE